MSSRRRAQRTDESVDSWTGSLKTDMERSLQLEEMLKLEAETPQEALRRLLSTKSAISTASSSAQKQQAAAGTRNLFNEIGIGSVGRVFGQFGGPWAFKVLLLDRTEKLWNNYTMHLRVQQSFDVLGENAGLVEVPRVAWFADKGSSFWDESLDLFPDESAFPRRPREVLCMERIFPLPEKMRHALIDVFCSPANTSKAKAEPANKDCLVRLLGRKRYGKSRPRGGMFFSLRNYKLHVDQIQELGLDTEEYAKSMAAALAIFHWHTKIDAMNVEFVLGSTPLDRNSVRRILPLEDIDRLVPGSSTYEHTTNVDPDFKKRIVSLWLLDFDACSSISMDEVGVCQAVKAFLQTDPFCPRHHSNTTCLFTEFMGGVFREIYRNGAQSFV